MNRRDFLTQGAHFLVGCSLVSSPLSLLAGENAARTGSPQILLVIDDFGNSLHQARRFLDLDITLTYAVLPRLPRTRAVAAAAAAAGHEVILHQPMEPVDARFDPGPGALYTGARKGHICAVLERNLAEVPGARGVNNHMGSLFTASAEEVRDTLEVLREKGLFFLDSLTTRHSVAYTTARSMGLPAACRQVFIDNRPQEDLVLRQLYRLADIACRGGQAVGIGHPHRATASALARFIPFAAERGIHFAPVSMRV